MEQNKTSDNKGKDFHIGLCLAGAVSAGAYTAGVMDYLLEALEEWQKRKDQGVPGTPQHNVVISVMGGASAGGMTTLLTASTINNPIVPVAVPKKETLFDEHKDNKLYNSWVDLLDRDMFPKMLDTDDIECSKVVSLLNSDFIKEVADRMICCNRENWRATPAYFYKKLKIFTTLSNLEGFTYDVGFHTNQQAEKYLMAVHNDYACFRFYDHQGETDPQDREPGWMPLNFQTDKNLVTARDAAMATGAFPIGLRARTLVRKSEDVMAIPWLSDVFKTQRLPEETVRTLNIDGGMINNEPFDKVRWVLDEQYNDINKMGYADPRKRQKKFATINCESTTFQNTVLMIDPFPSVARKEAFNYSDKVSNIIGKTLSSMLNQIRAKPKDYEIALVSNDVSRYIITPTRELRDENDELIEKVAGDKAIACGCLEGFGGFLSKEFRIHDYYLGRYNCEIFLRDYFTVPPESIRENAIFSDGYKGLSPEEKAKFASRPLPDQHQIIPIFTDRGKFPMPEFSQGTTWPVVKESEIDRFKGGLKKRFQSIFLNFLRLNIFMRLLFLIGAKGFLNNLIADKVLIVIKDALEEWKLIKGYIPGDRTKKYRWKWLAAFCLTIAGSIIMLRHPDFHVPVMMCIEFAENAGKLRFYTDQVAPYILQNNLWLDYFYIIFYTALFYFSYKIAGSRLGKFKRLFAWLVFVPGFFDIIENMLMLRFAHPENYSLMPLFDFYRASVWIKWITVVPNVLLALFAAVILVRKNFEKEQKSVG